MPVQREASPAAQDVDAGHAVPATHRRSPAVTAIGMAIKDLPLPPNSVIAAIIRHGDIVIPRGPLCPETGDEVLAIVDAEGAEDLARLFGRPGT